MSIPEQLSLFRLPPAEPRSRLRHLQIGARIIAYELRQAKGRRLAMTIDERGLRVGAPAQLSLQQIDAFVHNHAEWVVRKLDEYSANARPRHLAIRDGVLLPVLGAQVPVRLVAGANRFAWQQDALLLAVRPDGDVDRLARRALHGRALEHFTERVAHYAGELGRPVPRVALSSARTRWGSCSTRSGIRLQWRLVHLPPEFADYVIAHELAHLVHMDHSPRFWAVVEKLYPDWRTVRAELRRRAAELPIL